MNRSKQGNLNKSKADASSDSEAAKPENVIKQPNNKPLGAVKKFCKSNNCKNITDKLLRSFSLKRNMKRLFSESKYNTEDKELEIFNAIKVLSICLIVLGNTYFHILSGPIQNLEIVSELFQTNFFIFVF